MKQAAPSAAESFPHPRRCPDPSQPALLWLLLRRLPLCRCPAPQPEPCGHPRHLSFGTPADSLTCEQLLLKNRYSSFQRAKSLGQLGRTGEGHRLNSVFLCAPRGSSNKEESGMRRGLGTRSWCLCMLETISVSSLTSTASVAVFVTPTALFFCLSQYFLLFPIQPTDGLGLLAASLQRRALCSAIASQPALSSSKFPL